MEKKVTVIFYHRINVSQLPLKIKYWMIKIHSLPMKSNLASSKSINR